MDASDIQSNKSNSNNNIRPFRPSWIDYLVHRIESLPGQSWVYYLAVFLLTSLINNVVLWLDGAIGIGTFDLLFMFGAIYIVYGTGFYHYLTRVASNSLYDFLPVLDAASKQEKELEYRMTNLPAGWGWFALILGIILGFFDAYSSQMLMNFTSWGIFIYSGVFYAFGYGSFIALFFLTAKQLFITIKLHRQVKDIDLFNLTPLRAFSRLTATAGFATFFLGALSALLYSEDSDPSLIAFYIGIVMVGILIFVVPLINIRTQINKEKKQQLLESDQRVKHILEELRQCIRTGELVKVGELNTTLSALEKERIILKAISSYPWDPNTLKSFISTILLPLLLWGIKNILEKWL